MAPIATLPVTVLAEEAPKGITPFARFTHTYDTNLLNRSDEGTGPAPESDQVNRIEGGAAIDFKLSRQRFTGLAALSNTRHQRFDFRNTDGNAFRLRWDTEIGETLTGFLEGSSVSDQAPIQTGTVFATRRDQDGGIASLAWNFHANYSVLAQYASNRTRFKGPDDTSNDVLSGLNRNDETRYVGLSYQPFSGSSTALLFKQADGDFPSRQIVAPGQTVSNNFEQSETELLTKWKYSEITAFTLSLSSVNREHEEVPSRDFSGTNYRVEVFYKPTVKTSFNLLWGKQIVGVSDVTNSDALARQLGLAMNMELSSKLLLQLAYSPQELRFNGTDGFSTSPRTERLKEGRVGLEFALDPRLTLGTTLKKRSRDSTLANTDYSAESMNVFIRYEH
ncbi:MAG TPA: outer membrane beta-barrel protein [Limnobacter sp.]|nr:outer membrane beta-barrel protein [Limnobacter sp.]